MVAADGGGGRDVSSKMLRDLTETVGEGFAVEWLGVADDDVEGLDGMENIGDLVGDAVDGGGCENWERVGKSGGTLKVN